jgi:DNA-binding XRE family transcriptional regulator
MMAGVNLSSSCKGAIMLINVDELNVYVPRVLGRQVKRLRRENGLTQEALADRCDIYRTYLSRIEGGTANPSLSVLVGIARFLRVEIQVLFVEQQCDRVVG